MEPRKTINIASIASSLLVILTEISSLFQLSSVPTLLGLPYSIGAIYARARGQKEDGMK
jgi:hypothetical protein